MTLTSILHWRHKLSALFNGSINMVSSVLWAVGFGLLADAMKETTPAFWGMAPV
jgi:F0F1-type ATP synthase assembly protein I